jgi:hypothetical protein
MPGIYQGAYRRFQHAYRQYTRSFLRADGLLINYPTSFDEVAHYAKRNRAKYRRHAKDLPSKPSCTL